MLMKVSAIAMAVIMAGPLFAAGEDEAVKKSAPIYRHIVGTYQTGFDRLERLLNCGNGFSMYNNLDGKLAWSESNILMAYLSMYRATGNVNYLRKLIQHADNVLNQRDEIKGRVDYRGISGPTWVATKYSKNREPYVWVVHTGMITYPMADFAQLVLHESKLWRELSDDGTNFLDIANEYVVKIRRAISAHESQWDDSEGTYRAQSDAPIDTYTGRVISVSNQTIRLPGEVFPFNMYAAMGRTLIMMYKATGDADYRYKVSRMAEHFRNHLQLMDLVMKHGGLSPDQSYVWKYSSCEDHLEDIGHASIEVDFAFLSYKEGIVFQKTDMERFALTFTDNIYKAPMKFNDRVDGMGTNNQKREYIGGWMALSTINRDIYHAIADVYVDRALYGQKSVDCKVLQGIANCALYQQHLEPAAEYRGMGSASHFNGISGGDFDGDSLDEMVTVRNYDGNFYIYEIGQDGKFVRLASNTAPGSNSHWAGVAAGDFDKDGADEFVAVRNFDGDIYMYKLRNDRIVTIAKNTAPGSNSQWAGISAGDFDGDGADEFVAVRNSDGDFYMYELRGNQILEMTRNTTPGSNSQWAGIAAGDFDGDGADEFVAVRNADGNFYMYELQNNQIVEIARNTAPGSHSKWTCISAGDFDADGETEFIASRDYDGDFYIYRLENGSIRLRYRECLPQNFRINVMGHGRLESKAQEFDNIMVIRDYDANVFVYRLPIYTFSIGSALDVILPEEMLEAE